MKTVKKHFREGAKRLRTQASKSQTDRWYSFWFKGAKDPQHVFLGLLFHKFGGPKQVAKLLGVRSSAVCNWLSRGGVPEGRFSQVSKVLKVQVWGLNYRYFKNRQSLFPDLPRWDRVVEEYGFSSREIARLQKMGEPK